MGKIRKTGGSGSSQRRPAPDKCRDSSTGIVPSAREVSILHGCSQSGLGGCCFREASRVTTRASQCPRRGLPHEAPSRLCVRSSVCSLVRSFVRSVPPFVRAYVRLSGKHVPHERARVRSHFIPKPSPWAPRRPYFVGSNNEPEISQRPLN